MTTVASAERAFNASMTGAILIASGRVPTTTATVRCTSPFRLAPADPAASTMATHVPFAFFVIRVNPAGNRHAPIDARSLRYRKQHVRFRIYESGFVRKAAAACDRRVAVGTSRAAPTAASTRLSGRRSAIERQRCGDGGSLAPRVGSRGEKGVVPLFVACSEELQK